MGSEYPKKEIRRQTTSGHLRIFPGITKTQSRKSISSTSAGVTVSNKIPKTALTPISRLKKFQKLRDKNLRKQVLSRNNLRKQLTMLETIESQPGESPVKPSSPSKPSSPLIHKIENGTKENGQKENGKQENGENGLNGIEEEPETIEHNGIDLNEEVRRSPRRSQPKEKEPELHIEESEKELKIDLEETKISPVRKTRSSEVRDLEVDVIIDSPSSSKRRSTPRRGTPEVTSSLADLPASTPNHDSSWRSDPIRITGRRPIRDFTPPTKRKSDEFDEPSSKRMAYTPSVPSPGWRFLSPFSLFKRTPRAINRQVDDSLFVNVSTDSEIAVDLDTTNTSEPMSEENHDTSTNSSEDRPTSEPPSKPSTSWLCNIM